MNLYVLDLVVSENGIFEIMSVCLYVCMDMMAQKRIGLEGGNLAHGVYTKLVNLY